MRQDLDLTELRRELTLARRHSESLIEPLDPEQVTWRPHRDSSAIGWHLGHQAAVAHYLVRNLTAADPSVDPSLDALFDSATPEPARGELPPLDELLAYRHEIAARVDATIGRIVDGDVGAPAQLAQVAAIVVRALVNHEYQHAAWIAEVRAGLTDVPAPTPHPTNLVEIDGYWLLR